MKQLLIFSFLCILCISSTYAQKLAPEDTVAFVKMTMKNEQNLPYANKQVLVEGKKRKYTALLKTDKNGFVKATLPIDDIYHVYCSDYQCRDSITIKNLPYITYEFEGYSSRHIAFYFTCQNKEGKVLDGEVLTLVNSKTGEEYKTTADAQGKAELFVPQDDYVLHLNYLPHYQVYKANRKYERQSFTVKATWVGTKTMEIKKEENRLQAIEYQRIIDSTYKAFLANIVPQDLPLWTVWRMESEAVLEDIIWKKAEAYQKRLAENPKYYEEKDRVILQNLSEIVKNSPNPLLVVDVDSWIFEDVLIWQAIHAKQPIPNYLVVNDGGTKCPTKFKDAKSAIKAMIHAKKERHTQREKDYDTHADNSLQAIFEWNKKGIKNQSVVLLCHTYEQYDSTSIANLPTLKTPIHVVVNGIARYPRCCARRLDPMFMEIAYHTKGTLSYFNTIRRSLAILKENDKFLIGGWACELKGGKIEYFYGKQCTVQDLLND